MPSALRAGGATEQHFLLSQRSKPVAGWRLRVWAQPWKGGRGKVWPELLEPGLQLEGRSLQVAALGRLPARHRARWLGRVTGLERPGVSFRTMGQALSLITRGVHTVIVCVLGAGGGVWELIFSS